jgi:hypothetical protein
LSEQFQRVTRQMRTAQELKQRAAQHQRKVLPFWKYIVLEHRCRGRHWLWLLAHVQPCNIIVKQLSPELKLAAARSAMMLFSGNKNSALAEEPSIGL